MSTDRPDRCPTCCCGYGTQDTRTARLDRFAAAALTGLLANQTTQQGNTRVGIAAEACVQAECLLATRDAQDAEGGTR